MEKTPEQHHQCLVCGSNDLRDMKGYEKAHLCRCGSCGFVFCKPIPTEEELVRHYEGYQRNDYLSEITVKRYNELLDEFEKYRKTNRIIDVGSGVGYFLIEAKKRGWEVYGTEFTDEAVAICEANDITIHKGKLDPANYEAGSFDIITSFEVIEHINNPGEELASFRRILRDGGLVYLTTPNFNSLLRYHLKADYNVICYPEHLSYYTPRTLKKLFSENGFQTKEIQTTGFSLTRLRTSKKTSDQQFISAESDDEKLRNSIEKKKYLKIAKRIINGMLTLFGKGDSLKGRFVKTTT